MPTAGDSVPEGKLLALQLCFQLPTSGYATMLIRELLKETTATTQHRDRTMADQKAAEIAEGSTDPAEVAVVS